jgi:hypothetical protein
VCHQKIKATDAIFDHRAQRQAHARQDPTGVRLSSDAKAGVKVGPVSRAGPSRVSVRAADPDFKPDETLTPFGIVWPDDAEVYRSFGPSGLTAAFVVDCLSDFWMRFHASFPALTPLLINRDTGPENHARRPQFMPRLTNLADAFRLTVPLADYPPYPRSCWRSQGLWRGEGID